MFCPALLPGHILTTLQGLVGANLVRNLVTFLPGHIHTFLLGHLVADGVGHLLGLGLGHLMAGVIRVGLAGARDGSPDLGVALPLPAVLAVLLILSNTFCLCVGDVLGLELVHANLEVLCGALLVIHCGALCSSGGEAKALLLCGADLVILCGADLSLCLLVLSIPQSDILCVAHNRGRVVRGRVGS
jgi:hypothetical protein